MPIYEYACGACGHTFEEWQKMSDPPVKTCPKCKKKKVEKLISQTAFQLKGGGWYKDLYSSSKSGTTAKSGDKGGESGGGDKGAGGGEKSGGGAEGSSSGKDSSSASSSGSGDGSAKSAKSESTKDTAKKATAKKSEPRAA